MPYVVLRSAGPVAVVTGELAALHLALFDEQGN